MSGFVIGTSYGRDGHEETGSLIVFPDRSLLYSARNLLVPQAVALAWSCQNITLHSLAPPVRSGASGPSAAAARASHAAFSSLLWPKQHQNTPDRKSTAVYLQCTILHHDCSVHTCTLRAHSHLHTFPHRFPRHTGTTTGTTEWPKKR